MDVWNLNFVRRFNSTITVVWGCLIVLALAGCQTVHTSFGRPIEHKEYPDGLVLYPNNYELPQQLVPHPNDKTVSYHYQRWLYERTREKQIIVIQPSDAPTPLEKELKESNFLNEHLTVSNVLSYLLYEDGEIKYDALAPNERYTFEVSDNLELRSNSIGKSFVSYIVGHAICAGYIDSVDGTLSDWPLMQRTLYADQPLLNLLNMRARDHHVVTEYKGFIATGRWFNSYSIADFAELELRDSKPHHEDRYNYNGFITNVIMNYTQFKAGDEWDELLDYVFRQKVGIEHRLIFQKAGSIRSSLWYSAYASRYDYLRIARAMMIDWQESTCVGQYLKEVYERRENKSKNEWIWDDRPRDRPSRRGFSKTYGGQFHFDYVGMENRPIIGMDGYGGQSILIDPDNSRIVVVNTAHTNYNWYELVYQPIKTGKLRN